MDPLLMISVLPVIILLGYIYLNDKNEKYIEKMLSDAKQEASSAKVQAEKAEKDTILFSL